MMNGEVSEVLEQGSDVVAVDNNNIEEQGSAVAKRLSKLGSKIAELHTVGKVRDSVRSSLDDILDDVAHGNGDDVETEAGPLEPLNGKSGDLLCDTAHDSGVESPLENSIGTDSDCEKKDDSLEKIEVEGKTRTDSESGTENAVSADGKAVEPLDGTVNGVESVEASLNGDGSPRPLVNGLEHAESDELEALPERVSPIEDVGIDSRPASRRRKSTPKKRTYTPTAYDDSGSESDSYGDLDEAMDADEMHIIGQMEEMGCAPLNDDSAIQNMDMSYEIQDSSMQDVDDSLIENIPDDVPLALLQSEKSLLRSGNLLTGGIQKPGLPNKGLKKAEHKCPFCNFAYTSVNYVLSHLYRAHTDVDPVVLQTAIAQVTTWYKSTAPLALLESAQDAPDGGQPNQDGLDCVDGPLISNADTTGLDFKALENAVQDLKPNGCALMKSEKNSIQPHNRRTLMSQSYSCDKCGAKFKMHSQLETHMKRHRCSSAPMPCNLCGMVFFSADTLQQHQRTHLKDQLLTCDTCQATFRDETQFLEHQKTHNMKHDCVHCGRQYNDAATLTSHLKDHTVEGPIRCEKCDLWFADKSGLGQHLQIHGTDQLYQCQFCAYTFTEMALLRRHTESHLKLDIIELLLNGENCKKIGEKLKPGDIDDISSKLTKITADLKVKGDETSKDGGKLASENLPKEGVQYNCVLCPLTFPNVTVLLDHVYKAHSVLNDNVRAMQQLLGLATASMPLPMTPDMMNAAMLAQAQPTPVFNLGNLYPQMVLNKPVVFGNQMDQAFKTNMPNLNFMPNPGVLLNLQSPNSIVTQPLAANKDQNLKTSSPNPKTISDMLHVKPQDSSKNKVDSQSLLTSPALTKDASRSKDTQISDQAKLVSELTNDLGGYIDIKVPSFKAQNASSLSPNSEKKTLLTNHLMLPAKRVKLEENGIKEKKGLDQVDGHPLPDSTKPEVPVSLRSPLLSSMIAKADSSQVACTPRHFGFESDVEKPFSCAECGKRFKRNCHLQLHMRTHTDDLRAYRCSQCGMKFIQLRSLEMHLKTHSIEKPYNCQFCGKSFAQKYNLKLHIRTHTGEKPYGCAYCEMRFADPGSLNRHTRTHTGEKPYKCEHCGKKFAQKYNLHLHLRIHTHERPFRCVYCDKRFVQKNNLLLHLKVHAEIAVQNGVAPTPIDTGNNRLDGEEESNLVIDMSTITDQTTIPDAATQKQVVECHMQAEAQLKENSMTQESVADLTALLAS